jgi:hypothetical protein
MAFLVASRWSLVTGVFIKQQATSYKQPNIALATKVPILAAFLSYRQAAFFQAFRWYPMKRKS